MIDTQRMDDLQRRVHKDPASIAFAPLAEDLRRAGQYQQSVDLCRAGLAIHPGYLSARVTLGRALIDLDQIDEARQQLEDVRQRAPENSAAIRALEDLQRRVDHLRVVRTLAALEQWLTAIDVSRTHRRA